MLSSCVLCPRQPLSESDLCERCCAIIREQIRHEAAIVKIDSLQILSLALYQGPLKDYVHYLKGSSLCWKINSFTTLQNITNLLPLTLEVFKAQCICAVPSSRLREIDSYSLSSAWSLTISKHCKIPVLHPAPKRHLWRDLLLESDQKDKSMSERKKSHLDWKWPVQIRPESSECLLVDDIITTGSSLSSICAGLRARHYPVKFALTLLRSPKLK